jgi:hypothetical protein
MLAPYVEIIRDYQCGFRRNMSTTDRKFDIRLILKKKSECNMAVPQLRVFIGFKKAYDLVGREVLYNSLIEFGVSPQRPDRLWGPPSLLSNR